MQSRKRETLKRIMLGVLQHFVAALVLLLLAGIIFNSFLTVNTTKGPKTYYLNPVSQKDEFEESEVFQDLFRTSVQDIIQLVIIREQMEKNGKPDLTGKIDVTAFQSRYGTPGVDYGPVTVSYELEDLIKWGRYGLEYRDRIMSLSDFVNYYSEACRPENFALDSSGNLYFRGYQEVQKDGKQASGIKGQAVEEKMAEYTVSQLEDMAFSYILSEAGDGISMTREDDGNLTVYIRTLNCRYQTTDGRMQLFEDAVDWPSFIRLQKNVAATIETLTANYELYQNCSSLYEEGRSNLKYVVRLRDERGRLRTFANVSGYASLGAEALTEIFSDYRRYLIFYPDSLEMMGNTQLSEADVYEAMKNASYPEDTHIWIALDASYETRGDAFYYANEVFERLIPYVTLILNILVILVLFWAGLGMYLTVTAGVLVKEDGTQESWLNGFDHIWTEILVLLAAASGYAGYLGFHYLADIADRYYESRMQMTDAVGQNYLYHFGSYGLYGFACSLFLGLYWYSFIRRIRGRNLYRDSMLHCILRAVSRFMEMILGHQNSLISVLLPYNAFLLINIFAFLGIMNSRMTLVRILILAGITGVDTVIGMFLFRDHAEHNDIIDGINRIRSGQVDYKLEADKLHGSNRHLADAVNNIGDGIDNAVRTSMKDERLKTDLITNVSHDIRTPLTSIINYVDLLKRQNIQTQPAKGYIEILESKSQRLRELTDDLVEASKITSGNIELKLEVLDMGELLKQTIGEFSEKMEDKNLQVVAEITNVPAVVYCDSRRMWRIMENLFNNICKYAMEGTRVYAEIHVENESVILFLKNVSRVQMNIHADELTERFIRGDSSRSTEGSGLGLFIAKSLTNVQGGQFEIQLDADLFKVRLMFPLYSPLEDEKSADDLKSGNAERAEETQEKKDSGENWDAAETDNE